MKISLLFLAIILSVGCAKKREDRKSSPQEEFGEFGPNELEEKPSLEKELEGKKASDSSNDETRNLALELKPDFDIIKGSTRIDLAGTTNALEATFYQARASRQLISLYLTIKTFEKSQKRERAFKDISDRASSNLRGVNKYTQLYQANESAVVELFSTYASSVNKSSYLRGVQSGTNDQGNFADIYNTVPTAVIYGAYAMRDALRSEQKLEVDSVIDSGISEYEAEGLNAHKLKIAFKIRYTMALLALAKMDANESKIINDNLIDTLNSFSKTTSSISAYQAAQLYSKGEMDAWSGAFQAYLNRK